MLVRKYQPRQTTGYISKITILTQLARYIRQKREMMLRMAVLTLSGQVENRIAGKQYQVF